MYGWMYGVLKNIKIVDYILYAKKIYESKRRKYISTRKMKIIWRFIFSLSKRNIQVEGRKR
jgi:hypothetical protein